MSAQIRLKPATLSIFEVPAKDRPAGKNHAFCQPLNEGHGDKLRRKRRSRLSANLKSVTRMCRCEPLLSNQSNRWDELRQVRLSARSGLAQCCLQPIVPG
jgi:hypothetical protein